jgi:CheY-like chemotaxis protein
VDPTSPAADSVTVLIVDDDEESRDALDDAVRSLGYTTATACDGVAAWDEHTRARCDLILSDWRMPRMDGLALCKRVRTETSSQPYAHFILVTADADRAHFLDAMRAGADAFMAKPIDLAELEVRLDVIRRLVLFYRLPSG